MKFKSIIFSLLTKSFLMGATSVYANPTFSVSHSTICAPTTVTLTVSNLNGTTSGTVTIKHRPEYSGSASIKTINFENQTSVSTTLSISEAYRYTAFVNYDIGTSPGNIGTILTAYEDVNGGTLKVNGSTSTQSICNGDQITLTLTGNNGSLIWYKSVENGMWQSIGNQGTSYTTTPSHDTQYKVTATGTVCSGSDDSNIMTINVSTSTVGGTVSSNINNRCGTGVFAFSLSSNHEGTILGWESRYENGSEGWSGWNPEGGAGQEVFNLSLDQWSGGVRYWQVRAVVQNGTCPIARPQTQVTVYPIPSLASGSDNKRCGTGTVNLTASPGSNGTTIRWYSAPSGGSVLYTGTSYTTPSISSTSNYYAASYNSTTGCEDSDRKLIKAIVDPVPALASGSDNERCGAGTVTLTASPGSNGTTIRWYSAPTGGSILYTGTSYTTPSIPSTSNYYAASYNSTTGCEDSDRKLIKAIIVPLPSLASGSDVARCGPGTVSLLANQGSNGTTIRWYDASSGGALLHTGKLYTTPSITSTTNYYAASYNATLDCEDTDRKLIKAIIDQPSDGGTLTGATEKFGVASGTLSLGGTIVGDIIKWQKKTTGGWVDTLVTANTLPYVNIQEPTHYRAIVQNGTCSEVPSNEVLVNVLSVPSVDLGLSQVIRPGMTNTLTVDGGHPNYKWYKVVNGMDSLIQDSSDNEMEVTSPGSYKVKVTSAGGAISTTGEAVISNQLELDRNAVITYTYRTPTTNADDPFAYNINEQSISTSIYDGLGRSVQSIALNMSPQQDDIVAPTEYDSLGRQSKQYLPYIDSDLSTINKSNTLAGQSNFYTNIIEYATDKAYAETRFEPSPLNRPLEQGAPGDAWQIGQHTVKFEYEIADSAEVLLWKSETLLTAAKQVHQASQLYKNTTIDEDGNSTIEYTNKQGQTILKKSQVNATTWAETYYIYDIYGQLSVVLPPEATSRLDAEFFGQNEQSKKAFLNTWAFLYDYDGRNRMTMKKVPGADSVFMVYDKWDRLVLTQDGNQRCCYPEAFEGQTAWLFTKYDALNRPVMTGIALIAGTTQQVRDSVGASTSRYESFETTGINQYTDDTFPPDDSVYSYLIVTYYDNYSFTSHTSWDTLDLDFSDPESQLTQNTAVKGQVTGTMTKRGDDGWIYSVSYYDDKYRMIQTQSTNHLGGKDKVTNYPDFIGQINRTISSHNNGDSTFTTYRSFVYDHAGRLQQTWHKLNDADSILIAENHYNELGELIQKNLHTSQPEALEGDFAQNINYTYNIRGWLTSVNDANLSDPNDLFGMELHYDANPLDNGRQYFNGNIAAMEWSDYDGAGAGNSERAYTYAYDKLNRLTDAQHYLDMVSAADNPYDVAISEYDLNGNIKALQRRAESTSAFMDNLSYTYLGNQLQSVADAGIDTLGFVDGNTTGNDYTYDANGNMIADKNKGIDSIYYNHLNLPTKVVMSPSGGGQGEDDRIEYLYDAAGIKLRQQVFKADTVFKTTDYVGEFIYETDSLGSRKLQLIQHEEGRIIPKFDPYQQAQIDTTDIELNMVFDGNPEDTSGKGRNGTVYGAILGAGKDGDANGAYVFDGTDDYIDLSFYENDFKAIEIGTISLWFKTSRADRGSILGIGNSTGDWMSIDVGGNLTGSYSDESLMVAIRSGGVYRYAGFIRNGINYYNDGQWHHLALVSDANGNSVYIDGLKQTLSYTSGNASYSGLLNVNSSGFGIGRRFYPNSPMYFEGSIDELNIFSRALSEAEIDDLAAGSKVGYVWLSSITGYDYQYHLKDHLGNVRVTFSTEPENYTMIETFETGEENGWQDLHRATNANANTTTGGDEVELLQSGQTGAMIFLSVNKRDTINLSVQANYETAPSGNNFLGTAYNSLFTSFDNVYGSGAEGGVSSTSTVFDDALNGTDMGGKDDASTAPRAFLNYIFFDKEMGYVSSGFTQITTAAQGVGVHETVTRDIPPFEQDGYVLAYLSNENQEAVNVHFDDFTIYHGKTNVVSTQDYYPFGLTFNESQRVASKKNFMNTFQDQEYEEETGWVKFKWRNHDPAIGRFFNIDPLSESFYYNSPYAFSENKVTSGIELEGLEHVSHTIYNVHQDSHGKYHAKYNTTQLQKNAGDFNGIRNETQYHVYGSDGNVSAIYTGANSTRDLNSAGIEISSFEHRNVSASEIIDGAMNNSEFQKAGETLKNVATVAGMAIAGPGLAAEELVVQVASGASLLNSADDLSSNVTENGNTLIQNQLGDQNGGLVKTGLNIMGTIVGGTSSVQSFVDKDTATGLVNAAGAVLDANSARGNILDVIEY